MTAKDFLSAPESLRPAEPAANAEATILTELEEAVGKSESSSTDSNTVVVDGEILKALQRSKPASVVENRTRP